MTHALICIDFINEIVGDGKLAQKGYTVFAAEHDSLKKIAELQADVRASGGRVIHVHLGFCNDYADHPAKSPLLGGARAGGILQVGTPSVAIHPAVAPLGDDIVILKKRISAFFGNSLELTLRGLGVQEIMIAGVATDLAVQSAARDAHDRDFGVRIAASACIAATHDDHQRALENMSKFAVVAD